MAEDKGGGWGGNSAADEARDVYKSVVSARTAAG